MSPPTPQTARDAARSAPLTAWGIGPPRPAQDTLGKPNSHRGPVILSRRPLPVGYCTKVNGGGEMLDTPDGGVAFQYPVGQIFPATSHPGCRPHAIEQPQDHQIMAPGIHRSHDHRDPPHSDSTNEKNQHPSVYGRSKSPTDRHIIVPDSRIPHTMSHILAELEKMNKKIESTESARFSEELERLREENRQLRNAREEEILNAPVELWADLRDGLKRVEDRLERMEDKARGSAHMKDDPDIDVMEEHIGKRGA